MFRLTKGQFYLAAFFGVINGYVCWKPLFEGKYTKEYLEEQERLAKLKEASEQENVVSKILLKNIKF